MCDQGFHQGKRKIVRFCFDMNLEDFLAREDSFRRDLAVALGVDVEEIRVIEIGEITEPVPTTAIPQSEAVWKSPI